MSRRKNFQQSHWLIELSPRKYFEPHLVGICSTFRGSKFSAKWRSGLMLMLNNNIQGVAEKIQANYDIKSQKIDKV